MVRPLHKNDDNGFIEHLRELEPERFIEGWTFYCDKEGHGEFKTLVFDGDFSKAACPRCQECHDRELEKAQAIRDFQDELVKKYGVPADNAFATFDKFEIRDYLGDQVKFEDRLALNATKALADATASTEYYALRNVTLFGTTGAGKSYLGAAAVSQVVRSRKSALMIADSALLSQVLACGKGKGAEQDQLRRRFEDYQLLVIDDMDHERWHQAKCTFLADLLIARFGAMKQTLILSNRSKDELLPAFGSAVESRLKRGRFITVTGEDRRKRQKMQEVKDEKASEKEAG